MNYLNKYLRFFVGVLLTTHVTMSANIVDAKNKPKSKPKVVALGEGTSDGAGGNGFNRKMLESYVFHPENSPAFNAKIAGIIRTVFENEEIKDSGLSILKIKTWYLAPKKLKPIDKKALGVEFINGGVDQIAIQNESEIWIDSNIYDEMPPEEQSTLILHEVVMTYYLSQFLKISDICRLLNRATEGKACASTALVSLEQMDNNFPPQPLRALNDTDYQNIRFMTQWLLEQGDKLTEKAFLSVAANSGFDKRFNKAEDSKNNSNPESTTPGRKKLSTEEFLLKLDSARYSNTLPKKCHSFDTDTVYDCEITWTVEEVANPYLPSGEKIKFLTLKLSDTQTHKEIIKASIYLSSEVELWSASSLVKNQQIWYMYGMFGSVDAGKGFPFSPDKMKVGDKSIEVDFSFDEKLEKVLRISLVPYVLAGKLKITRDKDNNGKSIPKEECKNYEYVRYQGDSKDAEGAHMTESTLLLEYLKFFKSNGIKSLSLQYECHQVP